MSPAATLTAWPWRGCPAGVSLLPNNTYATGWAPLPTLLAALIPHALAPGWPIGQAGREGWRAPPGALFYMFIPSLVSPRGGERAITRAAAVGSPPVGRRSGGPRPSSLWAAPVGRPAPRRARLRRIGRAGVPHRARFCRLTRSRGAKAHRRVRTWVPSTRPPASVACRAWLQAAVPRGHRRCAFSPRDRSRYHCGFSFFLIFLEPFFSSATVFQKNKEKQKTEARLSTVRPRRWLGRCPALYSSWP